MAEKLIDVLGMDIAAEQQSGAGAPEVVEADALWQSTTLQQLLEDAH